MPHSVLLFRRHARLRSLGENHRPGLYNAAMHETDYPVVPFILWLSLTCGCGAAKTVPDAPAAVVLILPASAYHPAEQGPQFPPSAPREAVRPLVARPVEEKEVDLFTAPDPPLGVVGGIAGGGCTNCGVAATASSAGSALPLARLAALKGARSWNCPFPAEADAAGVDQATVVISVTVRADGTAASVTVLKDPGYGFGRSARQCALKATYTPAKDGSGQTVQATTSPLHIRFLR
jgi:hypothetical protein